MRMALCMCVAILIVKCTSFNVPLMPCFVIIKRKRQKTAQV